MTRFFKKELPKTPIYLPNGEAIQFEPKDGLYGYFKTDNDSTIKFLAQLQEQRRGGVSSITEEDYEASKKKQDSTPYASGWREEMGAGVAPDTISPRQPAEAAAAVVRPTPAPEPADAPTAVKPVVKPTLVGKRP